MMSRDRDDPFADRRIPHGAVQEGGLLLLRPLRRGRKDPIHCRKNGSLDADNEIVIDADLPALGIPGRNEYEFSANWAMRRPRSLP